MHTCSLFLLFLCINFWCLTTDFASTSQGTVNLSFKIDSISLMIDNIICLKLLRLFNNKYFGKITFPPRSGTVTSTAQFSMLLTTPSSGKGLPDTYKRTSVFSCSQTRFLSSANVSSPLKSSKQLSWPRIVNCMANVTEIEKNRIHALKVHSYVVHQISYPSKIQILRD